MAHLSKPGTIQLLVGLTLSGLLSAPSSVLALCTPQYIQVTEDPASKVLVGCCNADGTWKAGNLSQRSCVNPSNMCQKGHCDGTAGSTCNASYTNNAGDCVLQDGLFCKLGECQQQLCTANSDPDLIPARCDDENQCTTDTCGTSTYASPTCSYTALDGGETCDLNPQQTCKKGACDDGACSGVPDPGAFCGSASGNTCTPAHCDANAACIPDGGGSVTCTGTLNTCRKWQCSYNGTSAVCTQVKVNSNDPLENSCDTDAHDCKIQKCGPQGKCNATAQPVGTSCDSNFTTPLTDCYSGQCDSRKNCENEELGIFGYYDNVTCQTDSDVCTSQTCQGLTCSVTQCGDSSVACGGCSTAGHCSGTAPTCSCVQ